MNAFTVEAWVKPAITTVGTEMQIRLAPRHQQQHRLGPAVQGRQARTTDLRQQRLEPSNRRRQRACARRRERLGALAGTFDGATVRAYYDGILRDSENVGSYTRGNYSGPIVIGRAAYDLTSFFFNGLIDEVRISRFARYTAPTSPKPTGPFAVDADTVALWRFDEAGDTFVNAVGPKHAGASETARRARAEWLRSVSPNAEAPRLRTRRARSTTACSRGRARS